MHLTFFHSPPNFTVVGKLHMTPMKHEGPGSLHLDERHDHLLDLDLGLLICHPSR